MREGVRLVSTQTLKKSPPYVDRIWLWVYNNKIPMYPIFYLLKGDYICFPCTFLPLLSKEWNEGNDPYSWPFTISSNTVVPMFFSHSFLPCLRDVSCFCFLP